VVFQELAIEKEVFNLAVYGGSPDNSCTIKGSQVALIQIDNEGNL